LLLFSKISFSLMMKFLLLIKPSNKDCSVSRSIDGFT
jgi:hypothetical protein